MISFSSSAIKSGKGKLISPVGLFDDYLCSESAKCQQFL
jgi:hypothetical protein